MRRYNAIDSVTTALAQRAAGVQQATSAEVFVASAWLAYNELAWTDEWFADPAEYEQDVKLFADLLDHAATEPPRTLLHLGCGAGGHDRFFKRHFAVTGVDISPGMLALAREANPEIEYVEADMRSVRLNRLFDAVIIPDGIDYMVSLEDLREALETAVLHLKVGGVLLVVVNTQEAFQNNNFAYTGEKEGVHVTLFENNYIDHDRPNTYEATLVYLIRRHGEVVIHTDQHRLGLFSEKIWLQLFRDLRLSVQTTAVPDAYAKYLLSEGEHPLTIYVCSLPRPGGGTRRNTL